MKPPPNSPELRLLKPISYPAELPVSEHRREIQDAVARHPVVIVCGDTGSGKTTQLPKMLLELGRGAKGRRIAVTQPRRLAAMAMAGRVADELRGSCPEAETVGGLVGYRHRFARKLSRDTRIEFLTDGVLLAETRSDPLLRAYDAIVVDEAHERSLNVDFLLGLLRRILDRRRDLKVIVSSATMDTEKFAEFFSSARDIVPVIQVEGRLFPIEYRYRPPSGGEELDLPREVASAVQELPASGDVLVFLSGERDIRETAEYLKDVRGDRDEIIPLLASLPAGEQQRAFRLSARRRIILATNVAETSLTLPGIRAVVDSGLARISRYVHRTQVQRLQIEPVSQASARQRAGRCGRLGPGVCVRLYSEEDFLKREEYTAPEVLRSSLAGVILSLLDLGLGDIERFPFIDPPKPSMVNEGLRELLELGAIAHREVKTPDGAIRRETVLTAIGRRLARLPVEPRLARMLIAAGENAVLPSVLPIVAGMACDDPRRHPIDERERAAQAHAKWRVAGSDFLGTLKLWDWWREETKALSQSKSRRLALEEYLSYPRMREWMELTRQLSDLCRRSGLSFAEIPAGETRDAAINMSLLSGLLGRLGHYHPGDREYRGAHGIRFALHPGSVLSRMKGRDRHVPEWIVAGELVDTARLLAREAAEIDVRWIEPVAGAICKHHVHSPEWDAERGFVRATEQVTLYGLVIVEARRCDYSRHEPEKAREIFFRHGLLYGGFPRPPPAIRETLKLLRELRELADKARRPDYFDEDRLLAHFAAALPPQVTNANALRKHLSAGGESAVRRFALRREDWWPATDDLNRDFPDSLKIGEVVLKLEYNHLPEDPERDGVTCVVALEDAAALRLVQLDWMVPGLIGEKVHYLLSCLPTQFRKLLSPLDDAESILREMLHPGDGSLQAAVRTAIYERWGFRIPETVWKNLRLPPHLTMRYLVRDRGRVAAAGRDLEAVLAQAGVGGQRERGWTETAVRLFGSNASAAVANAADLTALYLRELGPAAIRPFRRMRLPVEAALYLGEIGYGDEQIAADVLAGAVAETMVRGRPLPANAAEFDRRLTECRQQREAMQTEIAGLVIAAAGEAQRISGMLEGGEYPESTVDAIIEQLAWLVFPGFPRHLPPLMLRRYPKYFKAMELRLQRAKVSPSSDRAKESRFAPYWQAYRGLLQGAGDGHAPPRDEVLEYRRLVEEYRIQVFAQELKTNESVSPARLDSILATCQS